MQEPKRHVGQVTRPLTARPGRTLAGQYTLMDAPPTQQVPKIMAKRCVFLLGAIAAMSLATAAPAPFDLAGPTLEVKVTRGNTTLPASQVPNLAPGDQVWIKADLPESQSAEYLMVAAFLSGSTNPPPEKWFFACKIWSAKCGKAGLTVTVPQGAQQVLLFLAPHTGGDLRTLIGAVRGRPGAFVRTSQDLNQAALDRSRLERFLSAVHVLTHAHPLELNEPPPFFSPPPPLPPHRKSLGA